MPRAALLVRSICLALVAGLLVLHVPLDVLRAEAGASAEAACCDAGGCDERPATTSGEDGAALEERAPPPRPTDGCAAGCQCACCGGLPITTAEPEGPPPPLALAPSVAMELPGARRDRPREVFHPPRA